MKISIIALACVVSLPVWAQDNSQSNTQKMQSRWTNEKVLNKLHHINQHEIEMSKNAQDKAQSQDVKSFARQMQSDHQKLEDRVNEVAKVEKYKLEKYQPATYEKVIPNHLKDLKGTQYDQMFTWAMAMGHKGVIDDMQRASDMVQDPQIKTLIQQAIPQYRQHMEMAQNLSESGGRGVASEKQQSEGQSESQSESQ